MVCPADAASDPDARMALLCNENKWKQLVGDLHFSESVCDRQAHLQRTISAQQFTCGLCKVGFPTRRALQSHERAKHGRTNQIKQFLSSAISPACGLDYVQRIRCLKHVSDPRRTKCRIWIEANCKTIPPAMATALDLLDREERNRAYSSGHSQPIASRPAKRADGRVIGRVGT